MSLMNFIPSPILSVLAFVLTITLLVGVHEYGHFWVARRFGVQIEKFSIGFGRPIFQWRGKRDGVLYILGWIPLGGYVKMRGEMRGSASNASNANKTTQNNSSQTEQDKNVGGFDALAAAHSTAATTATKTENAQWQAPQGLSLNELPPFKRLLVAFAGPFVNILFAFLAMFVLYLNGVPAIKPEIGRLAPDSALAKQHIAAGDTITAVADVPVSTMSDALMVLVDKLGSNNVALQFVAKDGEEKTAEIDLSNYQAGSEMAVEKVAGFSWAITEIGRLDKVEIAAVKPNSAAAEAGLLASDRIVAIDDVPLASWDSLVEQVRNGHGQAMTLTVLRDGQRFTKTITPQATKSGYLLGITQKVDTEAFLALRTIKRYGVLAAMQKSIDENLLKAGLMLKTFGRLLMGKASLDNLGGPLTIADYSGRTLGLGYVAYFQFLASISLALAVMNLLPIPVLDGGHIVMAGLEMVRGKPLSLRVEQWLMMFGGAVLLLLMTLTITLDVWRYLF